MALAGLILGYVGGILFIVTLVIMAGIWLHLWVHITHGGEPDVPPVPRPPQ